MKINDIVKVKWCGVDIIGVVKEGEHRISNGRTVEGLYVELPKGVTMSVSEIVDNYDIL